MNASRSMPMSASSHMSTENRTPPSSGSEKDGNRNSPPSISTITPAIPKNPMPGATSISSANSTIATAMSATPAHWNGNCPAPENPMISSTTPIDPGIQVPIVHSSTTSASPPREISRNAMFGFAMNDSVRSSMVKFRSVICGFSSFSVMLPALVVMVFPFAHAMSSLMSFAIVSAMPCCIASFSEYAVALNTVSSSAWGLRSRCSAMLRSNAAASWVAFVCRVSPSSSPCAPTGDAAPMSVTGAIASMFAAAAMNVPALAACAPDGET